MSILSYDNQSLYIYIYQNPLVTFRPLLCGMLNVTESSHLYLRFFQEILSIMEFELWHDVWLETCDEISEYLCLMDCNPHCHGMHECSFSG